MKEKKQVERQCWEHGWQLYTLLVIHLKGHCHSAAGNSRDIPSERAALCKSALTLWGNHIARRGFVGKKNGNALAANNSSNPNHPFTPYLAVVAHQKSSQDNGSLKWVGRGSSWTYDSSFILECKMNEHIRTAQWSLWPMVRKAVCISSPVWCHSRSFWMMDFYFCVKRLTFALLESEDNSLRLYFKVRIFLGENIETLFAKCFVLETLCVWHFYHTFWTNSKKMSNSVKYHIGHLRICQRCENQISLFSKKIGLLIKSKKTRMSAFIMGRVIAGVPQ